MSSLVQTRGRTITQEAKRKLIQARCGPIFMCRDLCVEERQHWAHAPKVFHALCAAQVRASSGDQEGKSTQRKGKEGGDWASGRLNDERRVSYVHIRQYSGTACIGRFILMRLAGHVHNPVQCSHCTPRMSSNQLSLNVSHSKTILSTLVIVEVCNFQNLLYCCVSGATNKKKLTPWT